MCVEISCNLFIYSRWNTARSINYDKQVIYVFAKHIILMQMRPETCDFEYAKLDSFAAVTAVAPIPVSLDQD